MLVMSLGPRGSDSCCEADPFPVVVGSAGGDGQSCQSLVHFLDGVECNRVHDEVLANAWNSVAGMDVDVDVDDGGDGVAVVDTLAAVGSDLCEGLLQTVPVEVVVRSFFCLSVSDKVKRKGEKKGEDCFGIGSHTPTTNTYTLS